MKTEIFLENEQLDINADLAALLTLALDDVRDFSSRQTSFSKTIILPGTANNNRIFGHIYDMGQANQHNSTQPNFCYNFNAAKSASCVIFQDNIQTFKGVLRITQINKDRGRIEYETVVFGELFLLNAQLSGGLIEDLDFSQYDHTLTTTAIKSSWNNLGGSGYYYPLIDYGIYSQYKHDWDYRTFRPALYAKEYIDKMFAAAGFKYTSALFNSPRFKNIIIPHNQKKLQKPGTLVFSANRTSSYTIIGTTTGEYFGRLQFQTFSATNFTDFDSRKQFTYTGLTPIVVNIAVSISGIYYAAGNISFRLKQNSTIISSYDITTAVAPPGNSYTVNLSTTATTINKDDVFTIEVHRYPPVSSPAGPENFSVTCTSASFTMNGPAGTLVNVNIGDAMNLNYCIPKNVRQIDFLVSIIKLFNLYVYEDKFDNRLIHIEPYVDFFNAAGTVDWTYKLNRNKPITIKPMSELNAKVYKYNYKQDSDYFGDLYNKRYGQGYGSYIFDSMYEFASQESKLELIFASTPLVGWTGEDKIYSTIFKRTGPDTLPVEENTDSIIRILQAKKITGVSTWAIKDGSATLDTAANYGYAGHLDDPDAPTNDLNFGAPEELFFVLKTGGLNNTQFNLYWSSYMAEITDKDSKLLTASFYLTPADIHNLDFSKYITIDGTLFRLNKVSDYNLSSPAECQVELLKVNYTQY